jgi:hypothetical protein
MIVTQGAMNMMKNTICIISFTIILVINSCTLFADKDKSVFNDDETKTKTKTLAVGIPYQGGIIAYILQSGDHGYVIGEIHGLITSSVDLSTGIQWFNGVSSDTGATGTAFGTGQANTTTIVNAQGAGIYAAQLCNDYINTDTGTGVYSDWYLPSQDELNKLYLNKASVGGFDNGYYWSSSEVNFIGARSQFFNDGSQDNWYKGSTFRVRAVRSF